MSARRWAVALGAIAVVGLAVRVGYVLWFKNPIPVAGDPYYYHNSANLLVEGHGFVHPFLFLKRGQSVPGADHPPAYIVALAASSLVGLRSFLAHQLWSCVIGTATIAAMGLAGREIAGRRAGLITAAIVAVYPNFWFNDAVVMSETLTLLVTAIAVLVAYRFWRRPGIALAAGLGVAVGVAALTRAEGILLAPFLLLPLMFLRAGVTWPTRLKFFGASIGAVLLTITPWVGYNLARFEHPEALSSNVGVTLQNSNCEDTYFGRAIGWWSYPCLTKLNPPPGDPSVQDVYFRRRALEYINAHKARVPLVVLAREGRTWGLFNVNQQITFDLLDRRELEASRVAFGMYYALVLAAIGGAVILRRRGITLIPLIAVVASVAVTVILVYGTTRFRVPAEVTIVLLSAVAFDAVLAKIRVRRRRTDSSIYTLTAESDHEEQATLKPAGVRDSGS
jgi:hypothetical protein